MLILHSDWYHQYSDVIHRILAIVTMHLCLQEYSISHPLCPPPLLTPLLTPLPSLHPSSHPSPPPPPPLPPCQVLSSLPSTGRGSYGLSAGPGGGGERPGEGGREKYVAEVLLMESVSDNTLPPSLPPSLPLFLLSLPPSLSSFSPSLPPSDLPHSHQGSSRYLQVQLRPLTVHQGSGVRHTAAGHR